MKRPRPSRSSALRNSGWNTIGNATMSTVIDFSNNQFTTCRSIQLLMIVNAPSTTNPFKRETARVSRIK